MPKILSFILLACFLSACGGTEASDQSAAVAVLGDYLQAFADKNEARMSNLICEDWSMDALLEYDAFQSVQTRLEGLSCAVTGSDGDAVLVSCQGKILASYQNEAQEFNLCKRVYRLEKVGPDWLVCGYSEPTPGDSAC